MAIARLSMKVGKVGKAQPHAAYIAREGQYANRLEKGEKLEASQAGNMPAWAKHDPLVFWQEADANERKNGSTYREMEIALPRELDSEQRKALVADWVEQEIGDKYAYQYAIHVSKAADGQDQPHVHLMYSERMRDGIDRDPEQYFKRYNSKNPELGGAKKDNTGKDRATRTAELKELRARWETMCNKHLERAGNDQRIDMRSYKDRGIDRLPEAKQLPSQWRNKQQRGLVLEFRQAYRDMNAARREVRMITIEEREAAKQNKYQEPDPAPNQGKDLVGYEKQFETARSKLSDTDKAKLKILERSLPPETFDLIKKAGASGKLDELLAKVPAPEMKKSSEIKQSKLPDKGHDR